MKVVLFCGGLGQRMGSIETGIPKPLVTIGQRPIIWHLLNYYAQQGHNDFILCLGHYGDTIRSYFNECSPLIIDNNTVLINGNADPSKSSMMPDWKITFLDTGLESSIGERLVCTKPLVQDEPYFLANYTDVLSDLPLNHFIDEFIHTNNIAGFLSVKPDSSSHFIQADNNGNVESIVSAKDSENWINGGFMIFRPEVFNAIMPKEDLVEEPFKRLANRQELWTKHYSGFWRAMDTPKDNQALQSLWRNGERPWTIVESFVEFEQDLAVPV